MTTQSNIFESFINFSSFMSEHFTETCKKMYEYEPKVEPKFTDAFEEFLADLAIRHRIDFALLRKYFIRAGVSSIAQFARMTNAEKDKLFDEFDYCFTAFQSSKNKSKKREYA